ncbi:MAG: FAD-binding oxidoreductase [Deltaproteobacteria bacterium]|nr:FAD-binding oxidoreductase [Deltaproteobacteria bacterium]
MKDKLIEIFGADRVVTEPKELHEFHDDLTELDGQEPAAVVYPTTTKEIVALVKLAAELDATITARVANTNVGGLAIAAPGGIIADFTRMNRIIEVDADEMFAVIEPGVTQQQLKDYLVEHDLPLTLGYSLAPPHVSVLANSLLDGLTNRSLKYGSMSQWISGLEVVLGDGSTLRTGVWAIEGMQPFARAPMPDLTGIFTAFQGTTGIVTKMAFQLWPKHPIEQRLFVLGYSAQGVFDAVQKLCRLEICEDIGGLSWPSGKMMMGVQHPDPEPDPDEPKWFLYLDLAAEREEELAYKVKLLNEVLDEQRAKGERMEEPLDIQMLLKVNPAMGAFADFPTELEFLTKHEGGGLSWMGTYGPLSRFAKTSDICSALMAKHGYAPAIVSRPMRGGHFGVLRFIVTFDKESPEEIERVRAVMRDLLEAVTEAGFAMYKTPAWALEWLKDRIDPGALEMIRRIKKLTDPKGLFNPGNWDI